MPHYSEVCPKCGCRLVGNKKMCVYPNCSRSRSFEIIKEDEEQEEFRKKRKKKHYH